MDIIRAKEIVNTLANGVDPTTGELLPAESVYNKPDVIRALFVLLNAVQIEHSPTKVEPNSSKKLKSAKNDLPRNAGKPWPEIEDDKLRDEFEMKMRISDIAKEHGRTRGAIESRLDLLGLKKKPFWLFYKR